MRLHLYLAPHLDDVVLSCGGLIARQLRAGDRALVLTVFAGDPPADVRSPFADELARRGQAEENYAAVRRAEDQAAVERLGAAWLHWPYPDCIYRRSPDGEFLYPNNVAIFAEVHPLERMGLAGDLAIRLQACCAELRPATVFAPMTVGHHVDHQLVQWAARRLSPRGWALRFYEDYPYVAFPGRLEAVLATGKWQAGLESLAAADLQTKIEAIACYRSQVPGLFGGEDAMAERVKTYFHGLSADGPVERYWQPAPPDGAVG